MLAGPTGTNNFVERDELNISETGSAKKSDPYHIPEDYGTSVNRWYDAAVGTGKGLDYADLESLLGRMSPSGRKEIARKGSTLNAAQEAYKEAAAGNHVYRRFNLPPALNLNEIPWYKLKREINKHDALCNRAGTVEITQPMASRVDYIEACNNVQAAANRPPRPPKAAITSEPREQDAILAEMKVRVTTYERRLNDAQATMIARRNDLLLALDKRVKTQA